MTKSAPRHNPVKAIRAHCLRCCGGSPKGVAECPSAGCALFDFRMGRNPHRAPASEKQKARALENLRPKPSGGEDD
jgi:hypothetical protein